MNKKLLRLLSLGVLVGLMLVGDGADAWAKRGGKNRQGVLRGVISALTDTAVTIGDTEVALTARTEYEDFLGQSVDISAFQVGDCVKVKLVPRKVLTTAREMELESRCPSVTPTAGAPDRIETPSPKVEPQETPCPEHGIEPEHDSEDEDEMEPEHEHDHQSERHRGGNRQSGRGRR